MQKTTKYICLSILILSLFLINTCGIFTSEFDLFEEPQKEILTTNCDDQGLRQATIYKYMGNAVTNSSIHVSVNLGCKDDSSASSAKTIFSAELQAGTSVAAEWKSLDTLNVTYSSGLEPIRQINKVTYLDSTLNVIIEYQEK